MGASGNALLAFVNKPNSGKKISVTNVEIQNNTRFNATASADTYLPPPTRIRAARNVTVTGGEEVIPVKFDTNSPGIPTGIRFYRTPAVSFAFLNALGTNTYTQAGATAGSITFTPGAAPGWIANQHRDAERYFIVDSGANAGRYDIIANTTTALTIDPPFPATASTTGYIAEIDDIVHDGFLKGLNPALPTLPQLNFGVLQGKPAEPGQMWDYGFNSNTQALTVRPNEIVAFAVDKVHFNMPMYFDLTIRINSNTYQFSGFTRLNSGENAIGAIVNDTGSGYDVEVINFLISETGTQDTPYFQLVPVGAIDPAIFVDNSRKVPTIKMDTNDADLLTSVCEVFTNAPLLPFGVPTSYIAEGAPATASPRGFNYLNTKDFIGPVYMTYFPESAAHKFQNTAYWASSNAGTFGSQISMPMSKMIGTPKEVVVREGEGFAIVSGAETATGTVAVGISGWGSYDFAIDIKVENAFTPSLQFTGLKDSTEVRIFDAVSGDELAGIETVVDGTVDNRSFTWPYDYAPGESVDVMIVALGYQIIRLAGIALTTTGLSIPIQQQIDRWYSNP